jgi:hypothetical protein
MEVPAEDLPLCPICGGEMEVVYDRHQQHVLVCRDCQSGITIPGSAWDVKKLKQLGIFKRARE